MSDRRTALSRHRAVNTALNISISGIGAETETPTETQAEPQVENHAVII